MTNKTTDTIRREGDVIHISMHVDNVQSLRVALQPCPCRAVKSNGTMSVKARLDKGLALAVAKKVAKDASL